MTDWETPNRTLTIEPKIYIPFFHRCSLTRNVNSEAKTTIHVRTLQRINPIKKEYKIKMYIIF